VTEEPRRAEVYAARRIPRIGRMPWQGYARCPACGWWTFTPAAGSVDTAEAAADAHVCPEEA
jgi:hypothetical protein